MNCPNCGAAMELQDRRRSFRCAHCGSQRYVDTPEAVDGVRVLAPATDGQRCPACAAAMSPALLDDRHRVLFCESCRGVLMPRGRFASVVHDRRVWASDPSKMPSPIEPSEFHRTVFCPACSARMTTHPYFGPGSVVIDTCEPCDLVWLDLGELRQITDAPGADRGARGRVRL